MSGPEPIVPIVDPEIAGVVRLGLIRAAQVVVGPTGPEQAGEIDELCRSLEAEHAGKSPSGIPGTGPSRELYRAFGIDPTKTRPSSEALLRRVIKGKPFPRISNAVDLCNYVALKSLLSLGLYDADKVRGQVELRRGRPGESFAGIRKDDVHVGGRIVLADEEGAFGNPTSDSLRTAVTEATTSLWMVIFAPMSYPPGELEAHVRSSCQAMERHLGGATHGSVLPADRG